MKVVLPAALFLLHVVQVVTLLSCLLATRKVTAVALVMVTTLLRRPPPLPLPPLMLHR